MKHFSGLIYMVKTACLWLRLNCRRFRVGGDDCAWPEVVRQVQEYLPERHCGPNESNHCTIGLMTHALHRAHRCILVIAMTYAISLGIGILMVHGGSEFALSYRDSLVARAHRDDPASRANDAGQHLRAAVIDFSRNLFMAAIPETIGGLTLVLPIGLAAYRGWVGGIVSVGQYHQSRLTQLWPATYYLTTLLLQVTAFTLAAGGGLHLGWATLRGRGPFIGPGWFRLSRLALVDVAQLYAIAVPLFAIGALWEFCLPPA